LTPAFRTAPTSTPEEALLDAAERLLVDVGHGGISTRRLAAEAGVNHGLVHYYYGSLENLFIQVLERFTSRMIERQRAMYSAERPFIEKWRTAMRYLREDRDYQKVWWELQALSWNRPELQDRVAFVNEEWRAVLSEALADPHARFSLEIPLDALVSLVMTFNMGIIQEQLSGITAGHEELLEWIDAWIERKEKEVSRHQKRP
jgi:AcrR family transcriptional regulator